MKAEYDPVDSTVSRQPVDFVEKTVLKVYVHPREHCAHKNHTRLASPVGRMREFESSSAWFKSTQSDSISWSFSRRGRCMTVSITFML